MNDILGNEGVEKTITFQVDYVPPEASTVIKNPSLTNDVISDEKPGSSLTVNLEESVTVTGIIVDELDSTSGNLNDGTVGSWPEWSQFPSGPGEHKFSISLAYTPWNWNSGILPSLSEGIYTVELGATTDEVSYTGTVETGPLFVKKSPAEINLNSFDETINSSNVEFSGSITDKFVEWGPLVEDIYGRSEEHTSELQSREN